MDLVAAYKHLKKEEGPLTCAAVVLGAGSAQRMGFDKMTVMLEGQPVLVRAVNAFEQSPLIQEIVVVTKADRIEEIAALCDQYNLALKKDSRLTAIHDGARPLVSEKLIEACIQRAGVQFAAIPVVKSTDTLRGVDEKGALTGILDRERVVRVQTPQVFLTEVVKAALTDAVEKGLTFTDDATAVERLGMTIQAVEGEEENLKLTTPQDLVIAQGILERRREAGR